MESKEQYEKSYKELTKIAKSISMDQVIIKFNNLDGTTANIIRDALTRSISDRQAEIWKVIGGVE